MDQCPVRKKIAMKRFLLMIMAISAAVGLIAQSGPPVETARQTIKKVIENESIWKNKEDPFRIALGRLLDHTREPYDSITARLERADLEPGSLLPIRRLKRDSTQIRWLNDSTFILDSLGWNKDLMLKKEVLFKYRVNFSTLVLSDSLLDENGMLDTTLFIRDTMLVTSIDTSALESLGVDLFSHKGGRISPTLDNPLLHRSARVDPDSQFVVFTDTFTRWSVPPGSPFQFMEEKHQLDSLKQAIHTLIDYNARRDSVLLIFSDLYGRESPFWITTGSPESQRFWVKNFKNDSITLWIGNPSRNTVSFLLEDDINLNRLSKESIHPLSRKIPEPDRSLADMALLKPIPIFWEYELSSAFTFNQTYFSNWSKGGESSIATMLDIFGSATFNNREANTQWINSARLKFGTLVTQEQGLRKNQDLFEFSSTFNRNASGKIGLSASLYMKNQLAKGYNYPNDSVVVSKFLNPGSITIGLGVDYKPFKHTSVNLAPLSYKNTFVLDTAQIDQTFHGIMADRRSKQELGTQVLIDNKINPLEEMTITSRLRLFSNYLSHPENIDIDWEMIVDQKISWFFTVRLDLHFVYDDDVKFTVKDDHGEPVLNPDGTTRKVSKGQFREFIGLALLFKF
jgi:hypothetical protein